MIQKITLHRLCNTSTFSNIFERNLAVESIWSVYSKYIIENYSHVNTNIFTFLFYFLEGFLRNGLRQTFKFKLSDYFASANNFKLHIGQTYFLNSTNLSQLTRFIDIDEKSKTFFIDPLLFVRVGNYYLDRSVLTTYVENVNTLSQNQKILLGRLDQNLANIENLFSNLYISLTRYYNSVTFSY